MRILKFILNSLKNKKGSSTIIVLITSTLLIGAVAVVTDAGMLYMEKTKLQNTVDAAALAGIGRYPDGEGAMVSEAYNNAILNGLDITNLSVAFSNNHTMSVAATKNVKLYFARIFRMTDVEIEARASAIIAPISAFNGIKPLGIEQQTFVYGTTYTLKHTAGDGFTGNYGALALGGSGSSNYKYNLINGYHGELETGDMVKIGYTVDTEPGNMEGPTYDAIKQIIASDTNTYNDLSRIPINSPRLFVVPIIDSFDVQGRDSVKIVGFARFFIEDTIYANGQTEVKGKFLKTLGQGEIDEYCPDYGFYGIKLVE